MEMIDLSQPITNGMHGHVDVLIAPLQRIGDHAERYEPPCRGFEAKLLVMSDHTGTHLDAPAHFIAGGMTVGEIPLSRLVCQAVVVDLTAGRADEIEGEELRDAMERSGSYLRRGDAILLNTVRPDGSGRGLSENAAKHLATLDPALVGTDHSGIDNITQRGRPGHMSLLGAGVPIVEGLLHLERLAGQRFLFVATPLNIEFGTGSPLRAVAILSESATGSVSDVMGEKK